MRALKPLKPGSKKVSSGGALSRDTKLAIAGAALGVAGLVATIATWRFPWSSVPATQDVRQEAESINGPKPVPTVLPVDTTGRKGAEPARPSPQATPPKPVPAEPAAGPVELALKSGEPRVVLNGLVGLSVEQSAVGEMQILTLRVSPSGAAPQNHAVLGSGARVEFRAGGQAYVVSVLSWNERTREAVLRVDRKS